MQRNGRQIILDLEAKERERTGIKTLKIGYNKVFGYYIDISKAAAAQVKDEWGYVRRQTLVNNERFISPELKEQEDPCMRRRTRFGSRSSCLQNCLRRSVHSCPSCSVFPLRCRNSTAILRLRKSAQNTVMCGRSLPMMNLLWCRESIRSLPSG